MSTRGRRCPVKGCTQEGVVGVVVMDLEGFGDGVLAVCHEHKQEITDLRTALDASETP